nr:family 1 glycosylhydrolase [Bacillus subtilis]
MAQTEQYRFPKDFWWGSSASATQTEGAADRDGKVPEYMGLLV